MVLQGEGPIHLIGSHCIDFFDNMGGEADSEGEDEEMEVRLSLVVFLFPLDDRFKFRSLRRKGKGRIFLPVPSR